MMRSKSEIGLTETNAILRAEVRAKEQILHRANEFITALGYFGELTEAAAKAWLEEHDATLQEENKVLRAELEAVQRGAGWLCQSRDTLQTQLKHAHTTTEDLVAANAALRVRVDATEKAAQQLCETRDALVIRCEQAEAHAAHETADRLRGRQTINQLEARCERYEAALEKILTWIEGAHSVPTVDVCDFIRGNLAASEVK